MCFDRHFSSSMKKILNMKRGLNITFKSGLMPWRSFHPSSQIIIWIHFVHFRIRFYTENNLIYLRKFNKITIRKLIEIIINSAKEVIQSIIQNMFRFMQNVNRILDRTPFKKKHIWTILNFPLYWLWIMAHNIEFFKIQFT